MTALSATARKRLNALADYLDRYASKIEEHFHMSSWFCHDGSSDLTEEHNVEEGDKITKKELHFCGTKACALGWACQVPALQSTGLFLKYDGDDSGSVRLEGSKSTDEFSIAAKVFDISRNQARYLFAPMDREDDDFNETPEYWAARCRLFLGINGDLKNEALPR